VGFVSSLRRNSFVLPSFLLKGPSKEVLSRCLLLPIALDVSTVSPRRKESIQGLPLLPPLSYAPPLTVRSPFSTPKRLPLFFASLPLPSSAAFLHKTIWMVITPMSPIPGVCPLNRPFSCPVSRFSAPSRPPGLMGGIGSFVASPRGGFLRRPLLPR